MLRIIAKTASSKAVEALKCEATPRHLCMSIRNTSAMLARPNVPISSQPHTWRRGKKVMTQARDRETNPNERPKTIGLRHETGPSHEPPSIRNTTAWNPPLANNAAATT